MIKIIYATFKNKEDAKKICEELLNKKLISCVNYISAESSYQWENKIEHSNEIVAIMKTKKENIKQIETEIKKMHSYDIPCILNINVGANKDFEKWVNEVTQ
jgi:periplasmic divalent cation tolerance protein